MSDQTTTPTSDEVRDTLPQRLLAQAQKWSGVFRHHPGWKDQPLLDDLRTAAALLTQKEAEIERAKLFVSGMAAHDEDEIERLQSRLSAQAKELEGMREALKPFVTLLDAYEKDDAEFVTVSDNYVIDGIDGEAHQDDIVLTVGDLRRARAALKEKP